MKPAKIVWMFWLGNLVVLGGIGAFLWSTYSNTAADRDARDRAISKLATDIPRKEWKATNDTPTFAPDDMRLSPQARPKPPVEVKADQPPPPPKEKTDEQLKSELQAELNRRFKLLRMMLSSDERCPSIAHLVSNNTRLMWFEDMYLKEDYAKSRSPELRQLAIDLRVITIDREGVLVEAASFEKPDKRFEVRISVDYASENMSFSGALFPREEGAMRPEPAEPEKAQPKEENPGDWKFPRGPEDQDREEEFDFKEFDEATIDELARYTKSTDNGIQVLPELPEDSPARKYGARGGEIIKTINGTSVKSMSDVRRVVRTQYDAGTREFVVGYEKDGLPNTRTFNAPEKKD